MIERKACQSDPAREYDEHAWVYFKQFNMPNYVQLVPKNERLGYWMYVSNNILGKLEHFDRQKANQWREDFKKLDKSKLGYD